MSQKEKSKSVPSRSSAGQNPARLASREGTIPESVKSLPVFCPDNREHRCPLGAAMFSEAAWQEIARGLKLSGQELRIVRGVFDDSTELAIAGDLKISTHTVHTHCERLYHKLGVRDRVKLVLRVMAEYVALTLSPDSTLPPLCANFAGGRCPLEGKRI
jgi:hypothetical protein